ncbi:MAG: TIGR02221 family CRISPR-associated protein [Desulfomonilaceae bacterium]|nr:TIGR02221 family CRISPR-associated protein [Desulfomonilaceae bacterium]
MAKVYISVLGVSPYKVCTYHLGDHIGPRDVRFVQESTVSLFCGDWTENDRILIFTTDEAKKRNWHENGHNDGCPGLERRLQMLNLPMVPQCVRIPDGTKEEEIWDIFLTIDKHLHAGDEVIFDVTHAFRSIPMLAIVVLQYAKVIKNVVLKGIYYGALEALGKFKEIDSIPLEKRHVPIFDLTPFSNLLDWSLAIDRFLGAGDASPACSLAGLTSTCDPTDTSLGDGDFSEMAGIAEALNGFSKALSACRGPEIAPAVAALKEQIDLSEEKDLHPPFKPLLERVRAEIAAFDGDEVRDGIRAARWCRDHNLIQQGYTILQESIITHLTKSANRNSKKHFHRDVASKAIFIFRKKLPQESWDETASKHPDMINSYVQLLAAMPELATVFGELSRYRNDLNHAGYTDKSKTGDEFKAELDGFITRVGQAII